MSLSDTLALGLECEDPAAGAMGFGFRALVFLVGIKLSSPWSSPPKRLPEPMDFRVLSVACFLFLAARVDHGFVIPLLAHFLSHEASKYLQKKRENATKWSTLTSLRIVMPTR